MRLLSLLLLSAALALPASAGASGTYAGWITIPGGGAFNDDPIVFTTTASGASVRSAVIAFRARCDTGQYVAFHRRVAVGGGLIASRNSGGHFAASLRVRGASDQYVFLDGGAVQGTFRRTGGRGTVSFVIAVADRQSGATAMTCRTGRLKWTTRRGLGRYYGGITSQAEPAVMTLTANRRMVYEFGIDLHSPCRPSGFMDMPDWITEFRVRSGRFGDTFRFHDKQGWLHTYRWGGRLTRGSASGFARMSVTTNDGTSCSPGHLTWRLRSG